MRGTGGAPTPAPTDRDGAIRLVVTGKGGVGKTTLSAALARLLAREGRRVLAVDADAQLNLAAALGIPRDEAEHLVPLSHHLDYIEEKTGARPGDGYGPLVRLNPDVDDVVERFGRRAPDDVRFLAMGTLSGAGGGCLCPENTLLAHTVRAVSLRPGEAIILDTQAGVEHFGRAIARGFGHAIVVTDPTYSGVGVAIAAGRLARDLGIPSVHLVINRVRAGGADLARVRDDLTARGDGLTFDTETWLPDDPAVQDAEPSVGPLLSAPDSPFLAAVQTLIGAVARTPMEVTT
jgi:CO dehydrogenase maturation factor